MRLLDRILYLMVDKNLDDNEIAQKLEIPITEVLRIKMRIRNSQHKSRTCTFSRIAEIAKYFISQ